MKRKLLTAWDMGSMRSRAIELSGKSAKQLVGSSPKMFWQGCFAVKFDMTGMSMCDAAVRFANDEESSRERLYFESAMVICYDSAHFLPFEYRRLI